MSRIYALSSVKFSGLKLWLCKKSDKYEVWVVVILEMMMLTVEPVMRPGVAPVQPGAAPAEHEAAFVWLQAAIAHFITTNGVCSI